MRVATTISDFHGYTNTWSDAVAQFAGTGFRYLDFNFHSGYYPNSPFLGPDWMAEVEKAAATAQVLGFQFVQALLKSFINIVFKILIYGAIVTMVILHPMVHHDELTVWDP